MGIRTRNVKKTSAVGRECVQLAIGTSAVSQTAKRTYAQTIPYAYQVVSVEGYCLTTAATISYDVQIGTTSVLASAITPSADALVAGTLSATVASTQGAAGSVLSLKYTSNGSGAVTNGGVNVWIRPLGMDGDPSPFAE